MCRSQHRQEGRVVRGVPGHGSGRFAPQWMGPVTALALLGCTLTACPADRHSGRATPSRPRRAAIKAGQLEHVKGVPILTLTGTAEQRGTLHGRLLAAQIRLMIKGYLRPMVKKALRGWPNAVAAAKKMEPFIAADDKREMRAMARAAGVTYEEILVFNTHVDVLLTKLTSMLGCSTVSAQGTSTGGVVYLARNVDFPSPPAFYKHSLLVITHLPGGEVYAYYGVPGFLAPITGLNAHGVAVSVNGGDPKKGRLDCAPIGLQMRSALASARSAESLISHLEKGRHCAGWLVTAADPTRGAMVLEVSAQRAARRRPQNGLLVSTNHFRTKAMRTSPPMPKHDSYRRLIHLSQVLRGARIDHKRLIQALHTKPVFRPSTIHTVIINVAARRMWLWRRGTPTGVFTALDLKPRL